MFGLVSIFLVQNCCLIFSRHLDNVREICKKLEEEIKNSSESEEEEIKPETTVSIWSIIVYNRC